jgi:hypothetical protein
MRTTDLPPTQKGRIYELHALGLRDFAKVTRDDQPLDPVALARFAKLFVAKFEDIEPFLTEETRQHLLKDGKEMWSGGAASQTLPDGKKLIILNPTHHPRRQKATLMEEICHVFYGHKPTRLAVKTKNKQGKEIARDYNEADEEAAYSTGAAALVPFKALRNMVHKGKTSKAIARHFDVSIPLVEYRIKVSRLWNEYKKRVGGFSTE